MKIIIYLLCVKAAAAGTTFWTKSNTGLNFFPPAGKEGSNVLLACRTRVDQDIVSGKLIKEANPSVCATAYNKQSHKSTDYKVLSPDADTTSWIPYNGSTDIKNIVSGQINREVSFVCRAFIRKWLVPGYLLPSTNACHVEIGPSGELYHEVKEGIEVLVVNNFGFLAGNPACLFY